MSKKDHIIFLLVMFFLMLLVPSKTVKGDFELAPPAVIIQEPVEIIEIPSWVREEQRENYLKIREAFPGDPIMLRISDAESDLCFNPINKGSTARGCFQIVGSTWRLYKCAGDVMNIDDNIACAIKIRKDGISAWNESRHVWGKYL